MYGHILPGVVAVVLALDAEVETVVVFTVQVFLGGVVLVFVCVACQGEVVDEVDVDDLIAVLAVGNYEAGIAAGVVVAKVGTYAVNRDELLNAL